MNNRGEFTYPCKLTRSAARCKSLVDPAWSIGGIDDCTRRGVGAFDACLIRAVMHKNRTGGPVKCGSTELRDLKVRPTSGKVFDTRANAFRLFARRSYGAYLFQCATRSTWRSAFARANEQALSDRYLAAPMERSSTAGEGKAAATSGLQFLIMLHSIRRYASSDTIFNRGPDGTVPTEVPISDFHKLFQGRLLPD
jgi:hypothetical protein